MENGGAVVPPEGNPPLRGIEEENPRHHRKDAEPPVKALEEDGLVRREVCTCTRGGRPATANILETVLADV